VDESDIQSFWNEHPCGDLQGGGLHKYGNDYEAFFSAYDRYRYSNEAHILRCLDAIDFNKKRVLEIGLGQGADSEQVIRRGAIWTGLDLTKESVDRVITRLSTRKLPYEDVKQGSVLNMPFEGHSFDIVFSHGVLHHVPEIRRAQQEIHRVLKPEGKLIVMVYAKWSLNYLLSIAVLRRLGLIVLFPLQHEGSGIYGQHLKNARSAGLWNYLRMRNFIHRNTDGPLNPYSKVYDVRLLRADFADFRLEKAYKCFMHAPPLPVRRLPFERALGWHIWAHMRPN
jgi:SAM-dependent methyltransferase